NLGHPPPQLDRGLVPSCEGSLPVANERRSGDEVDQLASELAIEMANVTHPLRNGGSAILSPGLCGGRSPHVVVDPSAQAHFSQSHCPYGLPATGPQAVRGFRPV